MGEQLLGKLAFTDGTIRDVFTDPDGRHFIFDEDERVDGVWLIPEEECDLPVTDEG